MKKSYDLLLFLPLIIFVSCCHDEPAPDVFMQITSIINEDDSERQQISYDSYGRVINYKCIYPKESVVAEYMYVSDYLVKITTKDILFSQNGAYDIVRIYQDVLHLENGRVVSCDGIFSQTEQGKMPFEKKYRHEFNYTPDNHLNTVRWTEWNRVGDNWAEDDPWTWEDFYYWENGNLVEIEDYSGHLYPYITYSFRYTGITGIQNVVPLPMGRYQYIPLQAKGVFGSQPVGMISEMDQTYYSDRGNYSTRYQYEFAEGRITKYQESGRNGIIKIYSVQWTK